MPNLRARNVPPELHRALQAKAVREGASLSDFVRAELERVALRPTPRELRERLRHRTAVQLNPPAADVIRERRDRDLGHAR